MDTPQTARALLRQASALLNKSSASAAPRVAAETAWMAAVGVGDAAARALGVRQELKRHEDRAYYLGKVAELSGNAPGSFIKTFQEIKDLHVDCAYQDWCSAREVRSGITLAKSFVSIVAKAIEKVESGHVKAEPLKPPVAPFRPRRARKWK